MREGRDPTVALLCSGLDSVLRGYETHVRSLFEALSADPAAPRCVLFKGDGARSRREVVLRRPSRDGRLVGWLKRRRGSNLYWESLFFALRFLARAVARRERFDTVWTIEPMVGKTLWRLRRLLGGARLVYTHGVWREPEAYVGTADVIHEVNVENFTRAAPLVRPPREIRLVPHFCAPVREVAAPERAALRTALGIATPRVLLSVGAINRAHKRMDHAIDEAARLGPDWTLVLCGEAHEPDLLEHGRRALGSRFVATRLPRDRMAEAYALADVFVLASTQEGFGIAILEAMSAGLPVLLHDRPLFRWILDDPAGCVDMTRPGALADAVRALGADPQRLRASGERNRVRFRSRFSWEAVRTDYLSLAGAGRGPSGA